MKNRHLTLCSILIVVPTISSVVIDRTVPSAIEFIGKAQRAHPKPMLPNGEAET